MTPRATNLAILGLLTAALATGAVAFAVGSTWNAWPTVMQGVVGVGLLVVSGWKWTFMRRGMRRRTAAST